MNYECIPALSDARNIKISASSFAYIRDNSMPSSFFKYCASLGANGFTKTEEYSTAVRYFAAYTNGKCDVFVNYYPRTKSLTAVCENNCSYSEYTDTARSYSCTVLSQITQIALDEFGMSYLIRLQDGRFIIIDGGREYSQEADRLWKAICEQCANDKPTVAAWFLSHIHMDHMNCFNVFMEKYGESIVLEKVMVNFPDLNDIERIPEIDAYFEQFYKVHVPLAYENAERAGAAVYNVHSGQRYFIGDAECEILSCLDDTLDTVPTTLNATSVIMRMKLAGQTILWSTDGAFGNAKLAERYGDYLKSDILQVPHHGFRSGDADAEMRTYDLIKPSVCLIPASADTTYNWFCSYVNSTDYLIRALDADEIIVGTPQRRITLPYTPGAYRKDEYKADYLRGRDSCGAETWIFSELSSANPEAFNFTLINMTNFDTTVFIDLYFEGQNKIIRGVTEVVKAQSLRIANILENDDRKVPENTPFAVRFVSQTPIVVSHKTHSAVHHGINR